jgi:hypothetical protein
MLDVTWRFVRVTIEPEPCGQCGCKAQLYGHHNRCSGVTWPVGVCFRCLCAAVGIWRGGYDIQPRTDDDYRREALLLSEVRSGWLHRPAAR